MQKRTHRLWTLTALAPLLFAAPTSARADDADAQPPLPAIVQKYVKALKQTPAISAKAQLLHAKKPDTATIFLRRPNILALTSRADGDTSTLVSNGQKLRQWDKKRITTLPAPVTLDQLAVPLPVGLAADLGVSLLTDSTTITADPNLMDKGETTVDGVRAHKVVSVSDAGNYTYWLASATGLPVRAELKGHHDYVVTLRYRKTRLNLAARSLTPPTGLVAFTPPKPPALLKNGTPAPDFSLKVAGGSKKVNLADYKGQVVLIDFWASWCPPCKMGMPHVQRLYRAFGPKGLTVLSVNTWDDKSAMTRFLGRHPWYTTTILFDPNGGTSGHREQSVAYKLYHVSGIPTVYLIGKDGNIAKSIVGYGPDEEAKLRAAIKTLGVE